VRENILKAGIVGRLVANDFSGAMVSAQLLDADAETGEPIDYIAVSQALEEKVRDRIQNGGLDVAVDVPVSVHMIGFAKVVGDVAEGAMSVVTFARGHHRADAAAGVGLHPVVPDRADPAGVLAHRDRLDDGPAGAAGLRRGSAGHPGAVHHLSPSAPAMACSRSAPGARALSGVDSMEAARAPSGCCSCPLSWRCLRPARLHHHPADPGAGDPRNGGHREPRHRRDHPHQPGAAAGDGVLRQVTDRYRPGSSAANGSSRPSGDRSPGSPSAARRPSSSWSRW
jgi:hypothetical protein